MRVYNEILSGLRESEKDKFDDLLYSLQNIAEMYDENMMDDMDDVFSGTQDSYANEMLDQHAFDTIYYHEFFQGLPEDKLNNVVDEVFNYVSEGNSVTEEWLATLLNKYEIKY